MPVTAGVLARARELEVLTDLEVRLEFAQLNEYVRRSLGSGLLELAEFDPEYTLSLLDTDIAVSPNPWLQMVRRQLVELIRRVIQKAQQDVINETGEYSTLIDRLGPNDSVLTLNWDQLLDIQAGSLLAKGPDSSIRNSRTLYSGFLKQFTAHGENTIEGQGYPPPLKNWTPPDRQFLKLHGSIDWYRCINSNCPSFERLFTMGTAISGTLLCARCVEPMELTIVPPTMDKKLRSIPVVRRIWNTANHVISRADTLVVWGYSAPPTDFFTTWLVTNAFRGSVTKLDIINLGAVYENGEPRGINVDGDLIRRVAPKVGQAAHSIAARFFLTFQDYVASREIDNIHPVLAADVDRLRTFYRDQAKARPRSLGATIGGKSKWRGGKAGN